MTQCCVLWEVCSDRAHAFPCAARAHHASLSAGAVTAMDLSASASGHSSREQSQCPPHCGTLSLHTVGSQSPGSWTSLKETSSLAFSSPLCSGICPHCSLSSLEGHQTLCHLFSFSSVLLQHLRRLNTSVEFSPPTRHSLILSSGSLSSKPLRMGLPQFSIQALLLALSSTPAASSVTCVQINDSQSVCVTWSALLSLLCVSNSATDVVTQIHFPCHTAHLPVGHCANLSPKYSKYFLPG